MPPGGEVGCLPAMLNDTRPRASDGHALWRGVPRNPACSGRAPSHRGRTKWVPVRGRPLTPRQCHLEPGRNRYAIFWRPLPLPLVRANRLLLGPQSLLRYPKSVIAQVSPTVVGDGRPQR